MEDEVWGGNTDGAIYTCFGPNGGLRYIWLGSDPAAVDPEQLAQQAVAAMNLKAVPIGIAPKAETGKIGIVGMPVWMWSTSGDPTVTGPVTQTASAGAVTVTATATLVSTVWDMDDGQSVTCWGGKALGTAYTASYGLKDSPTCGYRYSSQGDFTVTATSNWEIAWTGGGASGTIQFSLSSTADIRIGEVQVLVQ